MRLLQWLEENQSLIIAAYVIAVAVIGAVWLDTRFAARGLSPYETALIVIAALPAGFLLVFSLTGLVSYFVFIPSISNDGHLFARVHGAHLIHPLTTAVVFGLFALCMITGSVAAWALWGLLAIVYALQTVLMVRKIRSEHLMNGVDGSKHGIFLSVLSLLIGGEIVTVAAGAKPRSALAPEHSARRHLDSGRSHKVGVQLESAPCSTEFSVGRGSDRGRGKEIQR